MITIEYRQAGCDEITTVKIPFDFDNSFGLYVDGKCMYEMYGIPIQEIRVYLDNDDKRNQANLTKRMI